MSVPALDFGKVKHITNEINGDGYIFQYVLEYDGIRYHLLLEYNDSYPSSGCVENKCLQKFLEAEKADISDTNFDMIEDGIDDCLQLFWSHIEEHHKMRTKRLINPVNKNGNYLDPNDVAKIQLVTRNNQLQAISHNFELQLSTLEPVDYPVPDMVRTFPKQSVKRLVEIENGIFKVEVDGTEYCLKTVYREAKESFIHELTSLSKLPLHPSIVALKGVVIVDDGRLEGVLLQFIEGKLLSSFTSITSSQASKWKMQLSQAIHCLHNNKTLWGDAKPANIMVDSKADSICLIDFGGGWSPGFVDPELCETLDGDRQGVKRIQEFIDKLVESK